MESIEPSAIAQAICSLKDDADAIATLTEELHSNPEFKRHIIEALKRSPQCLNLIKSQNFRIF